jgi:hypothetical protein
MFIGWFLMKVVVASVLSQVLLKGLRCIGDNQDNCVIVSEEYTYH